ncbi:MAG: DsbA family protein [Hyphomicrobiaceae bacterium]
MSDQTGQPKPVDDAMDRLHFLYFADPMCSWCYGFSPVITELSRRFGDELPLRIVVGGLRAFNTRAMRPEDKAYIRDAWTRVSAASGQVFDHAFFERDGFIYDTEPACRAVVAMRRRAPGKALAMMSAISAAFYAGNRDTTDTGVLADVAAGLGEERDEFVADLLAPETRNETVGDFQFAQQAGVGGFPCLVAGTMRDGYTLVTNGYRPLDGLPEAISAWLARQAA